MPESQQHKENKIKSQVAIESPGIVEPPVLSQSTTSQPITKAEPSDNKVVESNPFSEMPSENKIDSSIDPFSGMPSETNNQDPFSSMPSEDNGFLKEKLQNEGYIDLDILKKAWKFYDTNVHERIEEGSVAILDSIANRMPWFKADSNNWAINAAIGAPKVTAEIGIRTLADFYTSPESIAAAGVGAVARNVKPITSLAKFLQTKGAQFVEEQLPTFSKIAHYPLENPVVEAGKAMLETKYVKQAIKLVTDFKEKKVDSLLGPFVNWTKDNFENYVLRNVVYKYGLPMKDKYVGYSDNLFKNFKKGVDLANTLSTQLHEGFTPEGQTLLARMLTNGYKKEDLLRIAQNEASILENKGIPDAQQAIKNVITARESFDDLGKRLVKDGLKSGSLNEEQATVILGNLGKYLPRLFRVFEDKMLYNEIKMGRKSVLDVLGSVESEKEFLKRVGGLSEDGVVAFKALSPKEQAERMSSLGWKYSSPVGHSAGQSAKTTLLMKRAEEIPEYLSHTHITSAGPAVQKGIASISRSVNTLEYFESISKEKQWCDIIPQKGWVKVDGDAKKFGLLAGKFIHPAIADDILAIYKNKSISMQIWEGATRIWKLNKVAMSSAAQMRNVIGNTIMMYLGGVPFHKIPILLAKSGKEMFTDGKIYKEAYDHNLVGKTSYAFNELEDLATDGGALKELNPSTVKKMLNAAMYPLKKTYSTAKNIFAFNEDLFKTALYMHHRELKRPIEFAAAEAEKMLFNYNKIPNIVKWARNNPIYNIPFLSYSVLSAPRIVEAAVMNPIKLVAIHNFIDNINETNMRRGGITTEEFEKLERQKGIGFVTGTRDSNGNPLYFPLDSVLPWAHLYNNFNKITLNPEMLPQSVAPGGVGPIMWDIYKNKDSFGKDISPEGEMRGHVQILNKVAYAYKQFMPPLAPAVPGAGNLNVKTAGPLAQRYADALTYHKVFNHDWTRYWVSTSKGYFGEDKPIYLPLIETFLGLRGEFVDADKLEAYDKKDIKRAVNAAIQMHQRVMRNAGVRADPEMAQRSYDSMMANIEIAKKVKDLSDQEQDDLKHETSIFEVMQKTGKSYAEVTGINNQSGK